MRRLWFLSLAGLILSGFVPIAEAGPITASWQYGTAVVTSFEVQRCQAAPGTTCVPALTVSIVGPSLKSLTDATPVDGSTYCYQIIAVNGSTRAGPSNVSCKVAPVTPPPPASNLVLTRLSDGTVLCTIVNFSSTAVSMRLTHQ